MTHIRHIGSTGVVAHPLQRRAAHEQEDAALEDLTVARWPSSRARRLERQLDRARRRRGRDAALAARLRARRRRRRALAGDRAATPDFFRVTKRLHNRLHGDAGDGGPLGDAERATLRAHARAATPRSSRALIDARRRRARCTTRRRPGWSRRSARRGAQVDLALPHRPRRARTTVARERLGLPARPTSSRPTPTCSRARAFVWERPRPRRDARDPRRRSTPSRRRTRSSTPATVDGDPRRRRDPRATARAGRRRRSRARTARRAGRPARATMVEDGAAAARRSARRAGLALGRAEGPDRRDGGLRRARRADTDAHLVSPGPTSPRSRTIPRAPRCCARSSSARWGALPAAVRAPRPPRRAADGRRRGERGDRQRAAARARRRRAEEPRRGLRPDRRRGDVEGAAGRREPRRRHPGPDRRRRAAGCCSTTRRDLDGVRPPRRRLLGDPDAAGRIGRRGRARARRVPRPAPPGASTWTCSRCWTARAAPAAVRQ